LRLQLTAVVLSVLVATTGVAETAETPPSDGTPVAAPTLPGVPARRRIAGRFHSELGAYADSDHVEVLTPSIAVEAEDATAGWSARGEYLVDAVSAASVDIVSTASRHWTEIRQAGGAHGTFKPGDFGVSGAGSFSSEPDYLAWAAGGSASIDLAQKNFTLLAGYAYGHDTIGRSGTPFSVFSRSLTRNALNGAVTVVVDPATVLVLGGDFVRERGDQSKPYRYIPLFAPTVAPGLGNGVSIDEVNRLRLSERPLEQLPLARDRYAAWARYLHRFSRATLRLEERLYTDTWSQRASSTDGRFLVDRGERWLWSSHLRFHAQSPVSFWQRAYTLTAAGVPALRTGDRELGPLWSLTGGAGIRWKGGRPRPTGWAIGTDVDLTWTSFLDDLYVTGRFAGIVTFVWEVDL
jgi:hypothetical protein